MAKATIKMLSAPIGVASEADLITNVLGTLPNGRFVAIAQGIPKILGQTLDYFLKLFNAPVAPEVIEEYTLSKSGTRFKVEIKGSEGDEAANLAKLSGLSTQTFASAGDFITTLLDGAYSPTKVKSVIVLTPGMNVPGTNTPGGTFTLGMNGGINAGDTVETIKSAVEAEMMTQSFTANLSIENGSLLISDATFTVELDGNALDLEQITTHANCIVIDQLANKLYAGNANSFTGLDPKEEVNSPVIRIERAVESGSFFE